MFTNCQHYELYKERYFPNLLRRILSFSCDSKNNMWFDDLQSTQARRFHIGNTKYSFGNDNNFKSYIDEYTNSPKKTNGYTKATYI